MGMFDSFYLEIKCPYCKKVSLIECQTKELDCELDKFYVGDHINTDKYNHIDAYGGCHSKECLDYFDKKVGYKSGFGRPFDVKIFIEAGIVIGTYEIIKDEEEL